MLNKKLEITIIELENSVGKIYKVTKRYPPMNVSETRFFRKKKEAKKQLEEWLN